MPKKTNNSARGIREQVPALDRYLTRIGAEEMNFRRFMVKQYHKGNNYYIEKVLITINEDGTLSSTKEEFAPTKDEAKAILKGIDGFEFPKSVPSALITARKKAEEIGGEVHLFQRRSDNLIVMLQSRFFNPQGQKVFVPWTFWSDGTWRKMEPEGRLPFWKPINPKRPRGMIMVHEGAKTAAFVDELTNNPDKKRDLAAHPWGETLRLYDHWGMIGGALAPHRTDYAELVSNKPTEVVYVCDNDPAGKAVLQEFSRHYGESLVGVKFNDTFKQSWDMADPIPPSHYLASGRFVGEPLRNYMEPATRATEKIQVSTSKRHVTHLMRAFPEEWRHTVEPEFYVHRDWPQRIYTKDQFNNLIRPFSDVDDTAKVLKTSSVSKLSRVLYDPSREPGIYNDGKRGQFINTYSRSDVRPEKGDVGPFLDYMRHLFPIESDRIEMMRWCATLIARPGIKMTYGVLLISETQGVGKSTLGEKILIPLVGKDNASSPSEHQITDSQFNGWAAQKVLAVAHEVYGGDSRKAYNRLKSTISEDTLPINRKNIEEYEIDNRVNVFACSNERKALKLDNNDRRWLIPQVTEELQPKEFWVRLNAWLEDGGLANIMWWAEDFLRTNPPVKRGEHAPNSTAKRDLTREQYSPGQNLVYDVVTIINSILGSDDEDDRAIVREWEKDGRCVGGKVILLDKQLSALITNRIHGGRQSDKLERLSTIRKVVKTVEGWHIGKNKVSHGMTTWGEGYQNALVMSNDETMANTKPGELGGKSGNLHIKPLQLDKIMKEPL